MKNILGALILFAVITLSASCEKDEGKLPNISFKTGGSYISSNATLAGGSAIVIGINASKSEKKDVLKKFNVSKSVNGAAAVTIYDVALSGSEGDNYAYDYTSAMDTISGQTCKYTFSVTNRDGLSNQVALTLMVQ